MALACDYLFASEHARFADTHARVGILPGWGLSQKLSRIIGINRAREMSLTGNFIDAERAEAWGLVNRVCAADSLLDEALASAPWNSGPLRGDRQAQTVKQGRGTATDSWVVPKVWE